MFLFIAFVVGIFGVIPLLFSGKIGTSGIAAASYILVNFGLFYLVAPSLAFPLFGFVGFIALIEICISAGIGSCDDSYGYSSRKRNEPNRFLVWGLPVVAILAYVVTGMSGCAAFRSSEYREMVGKVEKREWTKDVQPKDPRHVRLVPKELAYYLATKQLGEASGAIGSQFSVSEPELTLQMIHGELWYVAPLDFRGFSAWTSADGSPGYVMIHGEDPKRQVVVKTGNKFRYMPAAFFGDDLVRHLWHKHYSKYLTDYSFEIDEDGKPWWVVTVSKPTIAWSGLKTLGVLIVDPTTGEDKFYELGKVPDWVDRVVPGSFVEDYLTWFGEYDRGWLNSWWGKKNVFEPETPSINYGADGQPYWVTCITSSNLRDASMIGVAYTNSRTGESVMYHAVGGTDEAVLDLVNNKVAFRKLHGSSPVLYNIYGVMTSIVPLLGESHTYQGVAYVNITDMVAAIGDTQEQALVAYQKTLATSGQQVAPEKRNDVRSVSEKVSRFAFVVKGTETVFYLRLEKVNKIFSGSEEVSPKLPLTAAGDMVTIRFVNSGEGVQPIVGFENYSIPVEESNLEKDLEAKVRARQAEAAAESATRSARGEIGNMSDEEVRKLMELKKSATPQ